MSPVVHKITTRNARFQQWHAMLTNRNKRQRLGAFVVQGVRPITIALDQGWAVEAVLFDADRRLSEWAQNVVATAVGERFALSRELIAELGEKETDAPELIAIVSLPGDDPGRIPVARDFLGVAFDRPASPGNLGSVIRSADSFGAAGVIVTGHAADPYDSAAVRASTGSLFAVPTVRVSSPRDVWAWVESHRAAGVPIQIVGTDENGDADVYDVDLTLPTLLVVGNETAGLSAAWRDGVDRLVRIPMTGSASSLNAANAASVVLYEAMRQRLRQPLSDVPGQVANGVP
ncbi:TrmH family RNA methyltransferase [Rhodococcus sp. OK302]|uniref:TrmH family RNA methyltransferase n=1 Tax=Rhodococcus sp. OK302 TaxID=1882769 RepID=UPI000B946204|nr:TrmH family RNA methyltransferase [Rhodococcus sp. OK302]OYD61017.1 TrmH family RNA methyltransferase [Rhodococcus sp. OK302]